MARARLLKPGFFANEELSEMKPAARLLFMGLWTLADREGRLKDSPRLIAANIFPYEKVNVDRFLDELQEKGFIVRYTVEKGAYIQVVNFLKHQQPHYMEPLSDIPPQDGAAPDIYQAEPVRRAQRDRIIQRDGAKCAECGSTDRLSIDHKTPRSLGGTSDDDNLQVLCKSCNSRKRNRVQADAVLSSTRGQPDVNSPSSNTSTAEAVTVSKSVAEAKAKTEAEAPSGERPTLVPVSSGAFEEPVLTDFEQLRTHWKELIGFLTTDNVRVLRDHYGQHPDWVWAAVNQTISAPKPSWAYYLAIMEDCMKKNEPPSTLGKKRDVTYSAGGGAGQVLREIQEPYGANVGPVSTAAAR